MAIISNKGQRRIISNDGQMRLGITKRKVKLTQPDVPALDVSNKELIINDDQNMPKYVYKNTVTVSSDGSTINWATIPHGLSFRPIVEAFLNNVTIGAITSNGSLPLPTWTQAAILWPSDVAGANGIEDYGIIDFTQYLQAFADETNVYILLLNATNASVAPLTVTYYLRQEPAE